MRVYINSEVNLPAMYLPFVERITFADAKCWEFSDVEKLEYNEYNKCFCIFFTLNGKSEEVHLYGMSISDVFAVYTN